MSADHPGAPVGAPETAPERVVARVRRHGRFLILPALLLIAAAGGATYAAGVLELDWQRTAALVAAGLVVLLGSLLPFLAWLTRRATITTRRVILRSGVVVRVRQEIPHVRGYDVTVRRTPAQSMFRSGDVRLTADQSRPLVLKDVPSPVAMQSALQELLGEAQARRSAHPGHPGAPSQTPGDPDETVSWGPGFVS